MQEAPLTITSQESFLENKGLKLRAEIEFQIALMTDEGILPQDEDESARNDAMYEWAQQKAPYFRHIIDKNPEILYTFYQQNKLLPVDNRAGTKATITTMQQMIEDLRKKYPLPAEFQS